jgi:prephenate dehydrogenase
VRVKKIWQALGSKVIFMSPEQHDALLSCISHLPHFISFSLTQLVPRKYLYFAPASLKDLTRISNSSAQLWADIAFANRENLIKDIRKFIGVLATYETLLRKGDKKKITALLARANAKQKYIA